MEYPREDLIRMSTEIRVDYDPTGNRTLVGTPIVFDVWTEINGWEGRFKERIDAGAVTKTIEERGDKIKVLFNHGFDPQIGEKPLGKPSIQDIRDDALHVEVPLAATSYNDDITALLEADALDGMSFRFGVIADKWDNLEAEDGSMPERTITELRLYEYGPVTFPAYEATSVGVRSRSEYEEYRTRKQALNSSISVVVSGVVADNIEEQVREALPKTLKSDAAPGTSADNEPATRQSVSKQDIARLIRTITLTTGVKT